MIRPKQKLSTTEKLKGDWVELNAHYWDSVCKWAINETEASILYSAAAGELIEDAYTHVENPLNTKEEKFKKFPAKLVNIDIINSLVMMLMGEKRKRGLDYTAIATNSNVDDIRAELRRQAYDEAGQAEFINTFIMYAQQAGLEIDMEQVEQRAIADVENDIDNMPDRVAIQAQQALDYIVDYNKTFEVFMEGWYHFIVTGKVFSYRDVYRDEVIHEIVSPRDMKFYAFSNVTNLEDAESHIRVRRMSLNQIIDRFQDVEGFTKDVENELTAKLGYTGEAWTEVKNHTQVDPGKVAFSQMWRQVHGREGYMYSDEDGIEVKHVIWTSLVKIGMMIVTNIFGETIREEVDEDYIPSEGEEIEWAWVEQKWQCYLIDDKHVIGGEPILNCTGSYYSPKAKKSLYNGKILGTKHANVKSIVSKGLVFQSKYNIIHYYVERLIAKNLDSINVVPLSLVDGENGLGIEGSLYYASALGFLFVDDSNKNALAALNGLKTMNSNLGQSLQAYYTLLTYVKQEWEDSIGVTAPRKGQMNSSDGKAVTENAIFRSSIMTEEYFAQYEEFQERDLNFLMESSKYAFAEGKKATFINNNSLLASTFVVDGHTMNTHDFLVRISSSGKNMDKLAQTQALAQAFAQNAQGKFTPALKAIQGNNISEIVEVMEKLENEIQAEIEAQQQADRESQERIAATNLEIENSRADLERFKVTENNKAKIEIARMTVEQRTLSEFYNPENTESDANRVLENSINREVQMRKIDADERKSIRDSDAKKYQADKSLQVARENKGS